MFSKLKHKNIKCNSIFSYVIQREYQRRNLSRKRKWQMMLREYMSKIKSFDLTTVLNMTISYDIVVLSLI